jgi:hypothetical protein
MDRRTTGAEGREVSPSVFLAAQQTLENSRLPNYLIKRRLSSSLILVCTKAATFNSGQRTASEITAPAGRTSVMSGLTPLADENLM